MEYKIRFEGIGSTFVCARSAKEALEVARMFERRGKTNIIIESAAVAARTLSEFAKLNKI